MRPNRLIEGKHGPMLILANDTILCPIIEQYGVFAEQEADQIERFLAPGDVALDIGANIGALTLPMARRVGPRGHVLAFEPQRIVYQVLTANVALNSLTNVTTYHAACGETSGEIEVPAFDGDRDLSVGSLSLSNRPDGVAVALIAVDDLGVDPVKLIKIDVEGMELEVIRGCRQTIARSRPILYVENEQEDKSPPLIAEVLGLDYELWWHFPPLDPTHARRSVNMIGMPREREAQMTGFIPVEGPQDRGWQGIIREFAAQGVHLERAS